jgi:hypothetical protein
MKNARKDKFLDGTLNNSCNSKARLMSCRSEAANMYIWSLATLLIFFEGVGFNIPFVSSTWDFSKT